VCLLPKFERLRSEYRWLEADALKVNIYRTNKSMKRIRTNHDPWLIDAPYTIEDGLDLN